MVDLVAVSARVHELAGAGVVAASSFDNADRGAGIVALDVVSTCGWPICTPMKSTPAAMAQMAAARVKPVEVIVMGRDSFVRKE